MELPNMDHEIERIRIPVGRWHCILDAEVVYVELEEQGKEFYSFTIPFLIESSTEDVLFEYETYLSWFQHFLGETSIGRLISWLPFVKFQGLQKKWQYRQVNQNKICPHHNVQFGREHMDFMIHGGI